MIRRPTVPLIFPPLPDALGIADSGSPISIAAVDFFGLIGVDVDNDEPVYELPNSVGGRYASTKLFDVELTLRPPTDDLPTLRWRLLLGARPNWPIPAPVLFGQRGWFDRFPTKIDATTTTVDVTLPSNAR